MPERAYSASVGYSATSWDLVPVDAEDDFCASDIARREPLSQLVKLNGAGGEPSLFVKGVFDEIPVFKLFSRSMMGDSITLVCVTDEAIQGAGLEA